MCNYYCPKQERWIPTESIFPIFKMHLFNTKCRLCSGVSRFLRLFEWGETIGRMEPRLDGIRERRMPEFHSALSHRERPGPEYALLAMDLQGVPKISCSQNFEGNVGRLDLRTTLSHTGYLGPFGWIWTTLNFFGPLWPKNLVDQYCPQNSLNSFGTPCRSEWVI